ncbi:hypothetical protein pb186bvf_012855 [Paramecium bursaria]
MYKSIQIQIIDTNCVQDLGCYYSLVSDESKFIDLAILEDKNNSVTMAINHNDQFIRMTVKSMTDNTIIGTISLKIDDLLQKQQEEFTQIANIDSNNKMTLHIKLLEQEFLSPSPQKSSIYQLSSPKYLTVGKEYQGFIDQQSPQFVRTKDAEIQVDIHTEQNIYDLRIELENINDKYSKQSNELRKLFQDYKELQSQYFNIQTQLKSSQQDNSILQIKIDQLEKENIKPMDNILIEQIKKLKLTIQQQENQLQQLKQALNEAPTMNQLQNMEIQIKLILDKQHKTDQYQSILEERNKSILNLNQQLIEKSKENSQLINELQNTQENIEFDHKQQIKLMERINRKLNRDKLSLQILCNIKDAYNKN